MFHLTQVACQYPQLNDLTEKILSQQLVMVMRNIIRWCETVGTASVFCGNCMMLRDCCGNPMG